MTAQRISVIVAAYNAAATIGATLSGILTQSWPDVEAVVVDDGSTDGTADIVAAVAAAAGPGRRILLESQPNRGQAAARNRAMELATGEFLAICDADDILLPGYLARASEAYAAAASASTIVSSNALVLTPAGIRPGRPLLRDRHPEPRDQRIASIQSNIASIFALFPRGLVDAIGGFDERLRAVEDWDLWLRAVFAGWTIVRQDDPQAIYRWTGASVSSGRSAVYEAEDAVIRRLLADADAALSPAERSIAELRLAAGSPIRLAAEAEAALRTGDLGTARRRLILAAELVPLQRRVVAKARLARFPGGMRLLQARQRRVDALAGFRPEMSR